MTTSPETLGPPKAQDPTPQTFRCAHARRTRAGARARRGADRRAPRVGGAAGRLAGRAEGQPPGGKVRPRGQWLHCALHACQPRPPARARALPVAGAPARRRRRLCPAPRQRHYAPTPHQVGAGSIAALSTGGAVSKFGFPLGEVRDELVAAFVAHPWLNMLHLHVGSQVRPCGQGVGHEGARWPGGVAACTCPRMDGRARTYHTKHSLV